MFNLLRRSKNRRTQRQDNEESSNYQVNSSSNNLKKTIKGQNPHEKLTATIDALQKFNDLDGAAKALQEKQTPTEEREAYFAKIYFEDTEQKNRNANLAPTTLVAGKKPVSFATGSPIGSNNSKSKSSVAHDVLSSQTSKETERNSAIKKKSRRSLGFRKVDLDGVNSVIEAILPNEDVDGERSEHDQQAKAIRLDSSGERSNVKRRWLSQNEPTELSGHVSSQPWSATSHHKECKNDHLESNVSKILNVFNKNCESLATKTNGIGNVQSQITDQIKTATTTELNTAATDGGKQKVVSSEVPNNYLKEIKTTRRLSYFQRKNNENSLNESSTANSAKVYDSEVLRKVEEKKSQGPLQKGKQLLTDIFMARGRHSSQQRNRNQSQSAGKQFQQQEPCSNKSNAAVISHQNTCQNANNNKDNSIMQKPRNNLSTDNQISNGERATNSKTMLRQHLETTNSAYYQRDPSTATANQMNFSNNNPKNASRRDVFNDLAGKAQQTRTLTRDNNQHQHQRSNSAEHHRERGEYRKNTAENKNISERAYSEEPHPIRKRWSGALRDFVRVPLIKATTPLNSSGLSIDAKQTQPAVIQARNSEQRSVPAEDFVSEHYNRSADERERSAELTACARDRLSFLQNCQQKINDERNICTNVNSMGQTYGRNEASAKESRASTPKTREFHETQIPETVSSLSFNSNGSKVPLPKITVVDCSAGNSGNNTQTNNSPEEHEIFYEFESENPISNNQSNTNIKTNNSNNSNNNLKPNSEVLTEDLDSDIDDEVFLEQVLNSQPTNYTSYRHRSPLNHSPITLEDVPEQEEDDEAIAKDVNSTATSHGNAIDNEFSRRSLSRHANSASVSPERGPLKSCDSNLSNSYPDSGISGCSDSHHLDSPESNVGITKASPSRSSLSQRRHLSPFVRDSTSTDCDETLLQCDDLDCFASPSTSTTTVISGGGERLVCIESISLPDVVESTTSSPSAGNGQNGHSTTSLQGSADTSGGEQIININGATGNSMGNVHFIPIHVESDRSRGSSVRDSSPNQQQKRRSIDDNTIGSGMKASRFAPLNGNFNFRDKPTIEIIEEDEQNMGFKTENLNSNDINAEKLRLELQEQKSRINAQLEDSQKNVQNLQTKINDMQTKIVNLEQELSTKTWNVERLQSELNANQREDEFVRKKLRLLEEEKTDLRHKYCENEDEFRRKYEELETKYKELEDKYKSTQQLASNLQTQLAEAQSEAEEWHVEVEKIRNELEEQIRILRNALENSEAERKISEDKWQNEFEMLRTQHMDTEETLMKDCEWQIRQMQRQWKDKLDKSEHAHRDAVDTAEMLELELEARKQEVANLRHYEAEVKSLRGVVTEQHNSIQTLMEQIENLKSELHTTKGMLENQIEAVKKIKLQCDNALYDKERQVNYRIDEVRNEAACFWENKLHTEMTRLTNELESVFVDERRAALDKLQAEHVEELRALTTRYTANGEELQTELQELQERYESKCQEFLELREKTDNSLLQTRMHLDRADREYQKAMCQEEERREALEESLRKEFEEEKKQMEEKFCERLKQVKEELMKDLEISKQEMTQKHQKELEQHRVKLRAEKDEALHELSEQYRAKLVAAEAQMKEIELRHQRDLADLKATYDHDKAVLDKRDMSNANEIEQLHRRCRCLTNLFEEMRMRYERRDPRPEDLREIEELRTRCDSQERDLFTLTTTLREMQMQMSNEQQNEKTKKSGKAIQKPPPKTIPTSCDVIYEENEERDSPPPMQSNYNADENESADDEEEEDGDEEEKAKSSQKSVGKNKKLLNGIVTSELH